MKTLHLHFQNPYIKNAFQQTRAFLWKALAPKPFEIKTWDWSRLKDFSKISKNIPIKKNYNYLLYPLYQRQERCVFFFYTRGIGRGCRDDSGSPWYWYTKLGTVFECGDVFCFTDFLSGFFYLGLGLR